MALGASASRAPIPSASGASCARRWGRRPLDVPLAPPLLDTDVLIDYLRRSSAARSALESLFTDGSGALGCVVSKAETLSGMQSDEEARTEALLSSLEWVPVTEEVEGLQPPYPR